MVPFTLPGETVRARVFRNHKGHSDADLLEVVCPPSAVRTAPRCALFGVCGGCQYQHVEYAEQLRMKARHVSELLARTGGLDGAAVRPAIGSPKELGYRSKLTPQYNVERRDGERPAVGFVQARTRSRMVDVARCEIATDGINAALPAAREKVAESVAAQAAIDEREGVEESNTLRSLKLPAIVAEFAVGSKVAMHRLGRVIVRDFALFMTVYLVGVGYFLSLDEDPNFDRATSVHEMPGGISVHSSLF